MKPSDAWACMAHREIDRVEIDDLEGRITSVLLTPYPPGIPLLIPGERFNATIVEYLKFARAFNERSPASTPTSTASSRSRRATASSATTWIASGGSSAIPLPPGEERMTSDGVLLQIAPMATLLDGSQSALNPQGPAASEIAALSWLLFAGAAAILAGVIALAVYAMVAHRRRRAIGIPSARGDAAATLDH